MKKILFLLALASLSFAAIAQETTTEEAATEEAPAKWKKGAQLSINFSQVALQNWAAGGQNSMSGVGFFNAFANYAEDKTSWDNTLNLGYGILKQDEEAWFKSDDKLEFSSKYGYKATEHWYYSALIDFKTQFTKGYASSSDGSKHISNFMAPGYLNIGIGMDYKPNDNFTVYISPFTSKMTFVMDSALSNGGAFGVDAGDQFRNECGAYVKVAYKVELMENISYQTKIDLFSNYMNNPQNIDINWDNLLTFKINEYFNASFMLNLVYDDDIAFGEDTTGDGVEDKFIPKVQLKEMFGIGLTYKFKAD